MDTMNKVFSVLRVLPVEQQKLVMFNLEDSAWEWWKSMSTYGEQETMAYE